MRTRLECRHDREVAPRPAVVVALVRAGSKTKVMRLPARLRASLRVSISLRAVGQSASGGLGHATLRRRLGR